jgi:hypothetical protein
LYLCILGGITTEGSPCRVLIHAYALLACSLPGSIHHTPVVFKHSLKYIFFIAIAPVVLHELVIYRCIVLHELAASLRDHSFPLSKICNVYAFVFHMIDELIKIEPAWGCCHKFYYVICFCSLVGFPRLLRNCLRIGNQRFLSTCNDLILMPLSIFIWLIFAFNADLVGGSTCPTMPTRFKC